MINATKVRILFKDTKKKGIKMIKKEKDTFWASLSLLVVYFLHVDELLLVVVELVLQEAQFL